jgi:hypothetical protein
MTTDELKKEISIDLELIETVLRELALLSKDINGREPTVRERTAAAAFMAQFYGGIENILKRISRFNDIPLPTGDAWHIDLFKKFCSPAVDPLPALFDEELATAISPYRKFRHVVYHGYGFQLDWERMKDGTANSEAVFERFKTKVNNYLHSLYLPGV